MGRIKFMGSSHEHRLVKGDDFSGRLSEGLSRDVVFNSANSWTVDTEDAGLSEDAVAILVESGDVKDVTSLKRIPTNTHQQIFLALPSTEAASSEDEAPAAAADKTGDAKAAAGVGAGTGGTAAGGSTRGGARQGA